MTNNTFVYFSNSYGGRAIVNALQFKEMISNAPLLENEKIVLDRARKIPIHFSVNCIVCC